MMSVGRRTMTQGCVDRGSSDGGRALAVVRGRQTRRESLATPSLVAQAWIAAAWTIALSATPARAHFTGAHEAQVWGAAADTEAFGSAVATDADATRAYVGAPSASRGDGRVVVFVRSGPTWTAEANLRIVAAGARFGASLDVSADGTRMVVGAPQDGTGSARVMVRSGTSWVEEANLAPASPSAGGFGSAVTMSADGSLVVVGSPSDGIAAVFSRTGSAWSAAGILASAGAGPSSAFGTAVALSGDGSRAVVGAPSATVAGTERAGSAYTFRREGAAWLEEARLDNPSPALHAQHGRSVAIDGGGARVVIGGWLSRAFVFVRAATTWTQEAQLLALSLLAYQGASVSLDDTGTHVVVGLPAQDYSGRVYAYARSGVAWSDDGMVRGRGGAVLEAFGSSVAIAADASRVAVGAPSSPSSGVGYLFANVGDPCADGSTCPSGHCVRGVCCESACAGSCASCEATETGRPFDGACSSYSVSFSRTVVCRPSSGTCDRAETCSSTSTECPSDGYASGSTLCRASRGFCDLSEYCDGLGIECPPDRRRAAGTMCRPSAGACDVAEACDGLDDVCPADARAAAGTSCRASSDPSCDPEEVCTGMSAVCPADVDLCAMDGGVSESDAGAPGADAGAPRDDAGAAERDAGPEMDAGAALDAASELDAGGGDDAGLDAGAALADASPSWTDAGPRPDAEGSSAADAGPPLAAGACACRAGATGPAPPLFVVAFVCLAAMIRRGRRVRRDRTQPLGSSARSDG